MDLLAKVGRFLDGRKTYLVAILTGCIGIYMSLGHTVPEYVWVVLTAAGLGSIRSAIGNK